MADISKRTLAEIKEILEQGDIYLSSVTIPILKEIIFVDLGRDRNFVNNQVPDQRKLLDWFKAAKKAYWIVSSTKEIVTELKTEVSTDDNIN